MRSPSCGSRRADAARGARDRARGRSRRSSASIKVFGYCPWRDDRRRRRRSRSASGERALELAREALAIARADRRPARADPGAAGARDLCERGRARASSCCELRRRARALGATAARDDPGAASSSAPRCAAPTSERPPASRSSAPPTCAPARRRDRALRAGADRAQRLAGARPRRELLLERPGVADRRASGGSRSSRPAGTQQSARSPERCS